MQDIKEIIDEIECKYNGLSIDELIGGVLVETPYGHCYRVHSVFDLLLQIPPADELKRAFIERLELVYGIRENLWQRLLRYGLKTIHDLVCVPRYKNYASSILDILEKGSLQELSFLLEQRLKKGDKLFLILPALVKKESLLFVDIETDSLNITTSLLVLGIGYFECDRFNLVQYISLEKRKDERSILNSFLKDVKGKNLFITFCGRSFDIPVLQHRLAYYGCTPPEIVHLDLYHFARKNFRHILPNCKLRTIEEHILGLKRKKDIPGELVPHFYSAYEQTRNFGYIKYIVDHNKEDILSLVRLLSLISRI